MHAEAKKKCIWIEVMRASKRKYYMFDKTVDCSYDPKSIILHMYTRIGLMSLFYSVFSLAIFRLAFYQAHTRGHV